jgi:hypothetical protein
MSSVSRDRIAYSVGSEQNPGDPFGRSALTIEVDGRARLEQFTRTGHTAWTGAVTAAARDDLWRALQEARFPDVPEHLIPPGSAMRSLTIGNNSAHIAYHEAETMAGYRDAFFLLDSIIRQLSEDTVKSVGPYGSQIVESIQRESPTPVAPLSAGTAFALGYLPARRLAHTAKLDVVERNAATIDPALKHAIEFSRQALKVEESMAAEADARIAKLASTGGLALPPVPTGIALRSWTTRLADVVSPHLETPSLQAAWNAGVAARGVAISVELAALTAYLRCAAPDNADLRGQAGGLARTLKECAAELETYLRATELPLVQSHAHSVPKMVSLTRDLEPTTTGGYKQLNELVRDLRNFIESHMRQLDVAPPIAASSPPTAEEEALFAKILSNPSDARLRLELARLAERRHDPRATLIRLQLAPAGESERQQAHDLVRSHPEWTARLQELGARDIKFAGGFADEITIDAGTFLAHGKELLATAPLTRLHVRDAKGKVGELVGSPLLATIEALDLDDQGVTDDDIAALAASPHAVRLRQLDLRYNPLTARGIEAIAASPHLERLEVATFDGNPADPTDRVEYYDETRTHLVPTEAGKALEAKYGPLRWLHRT